MPGLSCQAKLNKRALAVGGVGNLHISPLRSSGSGGASKGNTVKTPGRSILTSAERLVEGEDKLKETDDPIWIGFLRRESSILLRRTFRFWLEMRFRKR